jgi:tetratricopeptide (TPR) repeat protein
MLDRPKDALEAAERALALSPNSVEFLRARATLATWAGDYARAADSYRRLLKLQVNDDDVTLNLARVSAWGGQTDEAVRAYRRYLHSHPDAADVWIELARTEQWRGNFSAALESLRIYRQRFGADEQSSREMAAVLARAGRPREALDILEPLLREHPDDYQLNLTRAIARTMQRRVREASDALADVRRLQPESSETRSAERTFQANLSSAADPGVSIYSDASTLRIQRVQPRASVSLADGTSVAAGFAHEMLAADKGSGLEQVSGGERADHDQVWVSAAHKFGELNLRGRLGQARTSTGSTVPYSIAGDLTPVDGVKLTFERSSGFFVVSPRTVGLGLQHVSHAAHVEWVPTLRSTFVGTGSYQTLSDSNHRWEFTFAPRFSVRRSERLNLDLGGVVSLLHTRTNFDNGYYDPDRYEYYAFMAYPYWKASENVGVGLSLGVGMQRDDFSPAFRLGGNATADATIGIYRPWALKVSAGSIFNQRLGSGAFRGYGASVSVIKRF